VPYVRAPEDVVPGRPLFFATAMPLAGVATPVLVENHLGRPTKIEGNPEHPASLGATDAITQAAVLAYGRSREDADLSRRSPLVTTSERNRRRSPRSWRGGAGLRFLSGAITSPSLARR
jgi:molybdopterin-containing oxidoreductase family iron-sulfur binding subunit